MAVTAPNPLGISSSQAAILKYLGSLAGPARDPSLAPMGPKQQGAYVDDYLSSHIDPFLKTIGDRYAGQDAGGRAAIEGATKNYSAALEPIAGRVKAIGDQQTAELGHESDALSAYLSSKGAAGDASVNAKLAAAGIDPSAAGEQGMGAGTAGEAAGRGYASKQDSTTTGGNNEELAALLPGFATLTGQNAENAFGAANTTARNSEEAAITQQIPGLTSTVEQELQNREVTKAGQRETNANSRASTLGSFLTTILGQHFTAGENAKDRKAQTNIADITGSYGVDKAAASYGLPDSALSGKYKIIVDHYGTPIPGADGQPQAIAGWTINPKTGKPEPDPKVGGASPATRQAAIEHADTVTRSILANYLKGAAKGGSVFSQSGAGGGKPAVGSPGYNEAVRRAVVALSATLGPYMSAGEITQFVQQRALAAGFAQPKAG